MRWLDPRSQRSTFSRVLPILGVVLGVLLIGPGTGYSLLIKETWAPDGPVRAIAHSGNTIYLGGAFSAVGQVSGPAVARGWAAPSVQQPLPKVVGNVRAVEPDGNGGWYLGGIFTSVQGQPRNNLAHIDASGVLTSWSPDVNGEVDDIALGSGVVYIAGLFTSIGGVTRNYIGAIDTNTGLATSFEPNTDGPVTEVEFGGPNVYLGGTFATVDAQPRNCIAEVNAVTGSPTLLFAGASAATNTTALELSDGKLYMALTLTFGNYVMIFDLSDTWLPYQVQTDGPVYDIVYDPVNDHVWVGGSFNTIAGQARRNLGSFIRTTGAVSGWIANANGPVRTLCKVHVAHPEGDAEAVLAAGGFTTIGNLPRHRIAMFVSYLPTSNFDFPGFAGGDVHALEFAGETLYAGGDFYLANTIPRTNLAALDATSGAPLSWNPITNAEVEALYVSGTTIYLGGAFSQVNGFGRNRAASVDAISGVLSFFDPNVDVSGATAVLAFARNGSTLYMAGAFGSVGGVSRVGVAAVDPTTGALQAWNANVNGAVYALGMIVPLNGNPPSIFLGGQFTQAGGQVRNNLASINGSTGLANTWNPSPNGWVHSLVVLGTGLGGINRVYVGGGFSSIGGQSRSCLAWIDATGAATSWVPNPNGTVYALATSGNNVVAAGAFTIIGGQPRNHIATVSTESSLPVNWDPNTTGGSPAGYVYKLLRVSDTIYAGGTFLSVAGATRPHFAGIWEQTATAVEIEPTPEPASWGLRASPNPFQFETTIRFSLASQGKTRVTVYDVAGRRVRELHDGWLPSGRHALAWDGRDGTGQAISSGIYFVGVRTGTETMRSKVYRR